MDSSNSCISRERIPSYMMVVGLLVDDRNPCPESRLLKLLTRPGCSATDLNHINPSEPLEWRIEHEPHIYIYIYMYNIYSYYYMYICSIKS